MSYKEPHARAAVGTRECAFSPVGMRLPMRGGQGKSHRGSPPRLLSLAGKLGIAQGRTCM